MNSNPIDKAILDEMVTSIYLGPKCETINQFMYASQLYGTFFCVYGIFEASDSGTDKKKIDKITLNVLNYKGTINVGLIDSFYDKNEETIVLNVKGMSDPSKIIEVDFRGNEVMLANGEELKLYRYLYRLSSAKADPDKHFAFDTEYYGRDGDLMFPRIRYEQLTEAKIKENLTDNINISRIRSQGNDITDRLRNISIKAPGRRCVPTTMIARF